MVKINQDLHMLIVFIPMKARDEESNGILSISGIVTMLYTILYNIDFTALEPIWNSFRGIKDHRGQQIACLLSLDCKMTSDGRATEFRCFWEENSLKNIF